MVARRELLAVLLVRAISGQDASVFGDAEAYEQFMGRWSRLLARLFVDFTEIPNSGDVLDVGSGTGSLAFSIAETKTRSRVLGIDPSKAYVEYAKSRNRFPDRVSFEVGDAQQLHFPDAAFESSLSLLVFNYIPDAGKALREARRVTKPGGRISAAVWDYGAGMRMLRVFWDAAVSLDARADKLHQKHMPLCRPGELAQLWRQGGLENVDQRPLEITMPFASFADFWDPFLRAQGAVGTYIRNIDGDRQRLLRGEVKQRLGVIREDMPFEIPARAWAVCGIVPARF